MTHSHPQPVPREVLETLRQGNRFLLTSHVNPDGDAIGSELGMARLLRSLGKGAVIWNRDETPTVFTRMPGADRIHVGEEPPAGFPDRFDGIVPLECPGLDRCGLQEALTASGLPILNLDHHLGNQHYGEVNWVDPAAPAVGEMVFRIARALKVQLDESTANCLYLALVTDTGGFRFSNATVAAFEAAAELVASGARPELVSQWLYESRPAANLRLLAEMLHSLELHAEGRVATARLTAEMYETAGAGHGDAEGLISYPRSIDGVEAVALVREIEGDDGGPRSKVSLRSRGDVNVEQIARRHGGGGHKNAAGYQSDGDTESVAAEAARQLAEALAAAAGAAAEATADEAGTADATDAADADTDATSGTDVVIGPAAAEASE